MFSEGLRQLSKNIESNLDNPEYNEARLKKEIIDFLLKAVIELDKRLEKIEKDK